ncbi:bifunctional (p)ppGpp synthetase/guanosine-3',5'-bis(diphosphate) 3'-pyrophosphohydrolase [Hyphomicrobium sp.]|uniref:RelA/SpoT family protein n=1 Tax=Hyphomicrobium sp. TaxID=82 RepID=UPI002E35DCA1|nr:bifunctional (p)ppGpp synthetase/guanosine-3',5'-bis(diphosphate) 3'-pyrophosphohydrolase [Hyphomicrobium sp.]HEX2840266.1 bifunctional (p)ppGpp synthetase/guanosine-3',5'-bis(diphosphate) 3'-pyrophosphohydrolase [Hyphomicrobium sp.]
MMRQYELVERVQKYDPTADEALLNRAYVYAMRAHGSQKRASGAPYFSHPLEVAAILTDLKLDDATIVTALLHDVIEDTDSTRAEIDQLFGPEIGALVDGLTKIKRLDLVSKKAEQAENFRKLLIAISSDIRVLLVKLADRLHNMRTLEHMKPESRKRVSEETLEIYAPLAGRMGMQALRDELEEHAFRWLNPDAYKTVTEKLGELREKNVGLVEEIAGDLNKMLADVGIKAEVSGREKKAYSVWSKMANKQISLEQLSDIYAFRVVVDTIDDCYRVLGVAHQTWRTVPGRFKDYISTPKQNNYQSIHTTVVGPRHQRVELQIRTRAMHSVAEYGVAAHALYKDTHKGNGGANGATSKTLVFTDKESGPYQWLRRLVETLLEGSNPEEFLEHTKLELFQDQVFCFTPKGRLIALPRGATPLDFAYAVHTDVGNAAVSAYVNGRHVPIDTRLRNGDEVEIKTSKTHTPPAAWESLVVTGRARSAIRRAARDAIRRQYAELGRRLLISAFERIGEGYSDERIKKVLPRLAQKSLDDLLAAVARNEFKIEDVLRAVAPELAAAARAPRPEETNKPAKGWMRLTRAATNKLRLGSASEVETAVGTAPAARVRGIPIRGVSNDMPVLFEAGGAVPGDRIVGVLQPGEGIRVFQIHSPRLQEFEHERWIDVAWDVDPENPERFPALISVTTPNRPGALAEIADVIGQAGGNIDNLKMLRRASDFTELRIGLEVWDLAHLNQIINGLRAKAVVSRVERVFE